MLSEKVRGGLPASTSRTWTLPPSSDGSTSPMTTAVEDAIFHAEVSHGVARGARFPAEVGAELRFQGFDLGTHGIEGRWPRAVVPEVGDERLKVILGDAPCGFREIGDLPEPIDLLGQHDDALVAFREPPTVVERLVIGAAGGVGVAGPVINFFLGSSPLADRPALRSTLKFAARSVASVNVPIATTLLSATVEATTSAEKPAREQALAGRADHAEASAPAATQANTANRAVSRLIATSGARTASTFPGRRWFPYRPLKTGSRRSTKLRAPSLWSSVVKR